MCGWLNIAQLVYLCFTERSKQMRRIVIAILLVFGISSLLGVNFYSRGSAYMLNNVDSWRTNRDGTGSAPVNFTANYQVFYVQNTHAMTASAKWTVTGVDSYVVVESGGQITTGLYDHQITGRVNNGGTYKVTNDTYNNLGWGGNGYLEDNSTFIINPTGGTISFKDKVSYGNLTITSGIADISGDSDGFQVRGTLLINGGVFEGAQGEPQVLSIANIYVQSGSFYGSDDGGDVTFNISGNVTVAGGSFYGSTGSGICTYNIGGNLLINGGSFYGSYRSSYDLAANVYNIYGNFTRTSGYYYAVNRVQGGYPSYILHGSGSNLGLGDASQDSYACHSIEIVSGASYTLTSNIPMGSSKTFSLRGTLDAGTYQLKATGASVIFRIYGTVKTANTNGLNGSTATTFSSTNSPTVDLWAPLECTVEYTSGSSQTITPRTDYRNLTISGIGTKTINGAVTVATAFSIGGTLTIKATTISSGSIAVNASTSINTGVTLNINGSMSGNSTITGGNVSIGGSGSQLTLRSLNVENITLNRYLGSKMYADVQTTNLILTQGTFEIGDYTFTITGTVSGGGSWTGGNNSKLSVGGSGSSFNLPAGLVLHTLTCSRSPAVVMNGSLTLKDLSLQSGELKIMPNNTLSVSGTMTWNNWGVLTPSYSSTVVMTAGSANGDIYPFNDGNLTIDCSGRTCYLNGSMSVQILTLNSGTLSIGSNLLTIASALIPNGGTLLGGSSSNLGINSTTYNVSIPAIVLNTLYQAGDYTHLSGSVTVDDIYLLRGILDLDETQLTIQRNLSFVSSVDPLPQITGEVSSTLNYYSTSGDPQTLPPFNVGALGVSTAGGCIVGYSSTVQSQLILARGTLNPDGKLSMQSGTAIQRMQGSLVGPPVFSGSVRVSYFGNMSTGYELPTGDGVLEQLMVAGAGFRITATQNIYLEDFLFLGSDCMLIMDGYTLFMEPNTLVNAMPNSLIFGTVQQDISLNGINAPYLGIVIEPGVMVDGFAVTHLPVAQSSGGYSGILRTWSLQGSPSGPVNLTFTWDISADNGHTFSPLNLAVIYTRDGGPWTAAGSPQDVSLMIPRRISVITSHFSDWTVSSEESTLPVVLSSFTATISAQNFVNVLWQTQSETGVLGFYIYRAASSNLEQATRISPLVPATNTSSSQTYTFTDYDLTDNGVYYYWLQSLDYDGGNEFHGPVSVNFSTNGNGPGTPPIPLQTSLKVIYPNPFNPVAYISFDIAQKTSVRFWIVNARGQVIRSIDSGEMQPGTHHIIWDGCDNTGKICATGVYIIRMQAGGEVFSQKAVLIK